MTEHRHPGRRRWLVFTIGYSLGALFLAAFILIGGRELWTSGQGKFIAPGRSASVDAHLQTLLGVQNASEKCLAAMTKVRSPKPVVFVCPRDDAAGDFIYYLLAYLTWPQKIEKIDIDDAQLSSKDFDRTAKSAFVFFKVSPPPGLTRGWPIGSSLLIVPLEPTP